MGMKIWELHGSRLHGAIRTSPEGEADISGLVLTEKAYLLALRDFRPSDLVRMVRETGPEAAAQALVAHYSGDGIWKATGGRGLVAARNHSFGTTVRRSDEVSPVASQARPVFAR